MSLRYLQLVYSQIAILESLVSTSLVAQVNTGTLTVSEGFGYQTGIWYYELDLLTYFSR